MVTSKSTKENVKKESGSETGHDCSCGSTGEQATVESGNPHSAFKPGPSGITLLKTLNHCKCEQTANPTTHRY